MVHVMIQALVLLSIIKCIVTAKLEYVWYLGGSFNRTYVHKGNTTQIIVANNFAVWTGSTWQAMGSGTNGQVRSIYVDDCQNIYLAGNFTFAGKNQTFAFAKWTSISQDWEPIFAPDQSPTFFQGYVNSIYADCIFKTTNWPKCKCHVYIGGKFTLTDKNGNTARNLIKWDAWTNSWDFLGLSNSTYLEQDEVLVVKKQTVSLAESLDILWVGLLHKGLKFYNLRGFKPLWEGFNRTLSNMTFEFNGTVRDILYEPSLMDAYEVIFIGDFALPICTNLCMYNYKKNRLQGFALNATVGQGLFMQDSVYTFGSISVNASTYGVTRTDAIPDLTTNGTNIRQMIMCSDFQYDCSAGTIAAITHNGVFLFREGSQNNLSRFENATNGVFFSLSSHLRYASANITVVSFMLLLLCLGVNFI